MLDLSHIANAVKASQAPPPQAQAPIAQALKPVPEAEIENAVPPLPAKGGEPGLGEHLDLYDTENPIVKDPRVSAAASEKKAVAETAGKAVVPETDGTSEEPPQPEPVHVELPFLKPLGEDFLGQAIDARI